MCRTCDYCETELTSKWVDKRTRYCSRKCANLARVGTDFYTTHSRILKEKYKKDGAWGSIGKNYSDISNTSSEKPIKSRIYKKKSLREKVEGKSFDEVSWDYKRIMVIISQDETCNRCKLSEWMGDKIPLEIDHIDGNSKNDSRENLEALCANCHAQTTTFRGRNKSRGKFPASNIFYSKYKELGNIRQTLMFFDLAAKGSNYEKAKKMIQNADYDAEFLTEMEYHKL